MSMVVACTVWPVGESVAVGLDMTESQGPIEVVADNGIEWQRMQRRFIARGNAVATRNTVAVHADELYAYYGDDKVAPSHTTPASDNPAGASTIERLEAHGSVRIVSPTETATGGEAVYDLTMGTVVLTNQTGKVRLVTQKETVTAEDALEYDVHTQTAKALGNAELIQGDRVLHANVLTARMQTVAGKTELNTVDASGNVLITTDTETARGSHGTYDAKTGIATLTGSVTLTRGKTVLNGGKATVNMKTGISTLLGSSAMNGKARAILAPGNGDTPGRIE